MNDYEGEDHSARTNHRRRRRRRLAPECYLGKKRLERALAEEHGEPIKVHWRPYQLDPSILAKGGPRNRRTYMINKFGNDGRIEAAHERLKALGAEEGIAFAFDKITRAPNTLDAHRLIRWAFVTGAQDKVVDRLFSLYFEQGRDIGERALLIETAEQCGMDREIVEKLFAEGRRRARGSPRRNRRGAEARRDRRAVLHLRPAFRRPRRARRRCADRRHRASAQKRRRRRGRIIGDLPLSRGWCRMRPHRRHASRAAIGSVAVQIRSRLKARCRPVLNFRMNRAYRRLRPFARGACETYR